MLPLILLVLAFIAAPLGDTAFAQSKYKEAPILAEQVKAGKLPAVDQRLPSEPLVVPTVERTGQYGGVWRRAFLGLADANNYVRVVYDALVRHSPERVSNIKPVLRRGVPGGGHAPQTHPRESADPGQAAAADCRSRLRQQCRAAPPQAAPHSADHPRPPEQYAGHGPRRWLPPPLSAALDCRTHDRLARQLPQTDGALCPTSAERTPLSPDLYRARLVGA
ncbi:MAG: hypothetical protein Q7W02_10785 [Candidatus Rokubacteria bacterium]|nr:hypothetical protein [Candidatus Rokubacteria bacterium]